MTTQNVDLDAGIAMTEIKPSYLLDRKRLLIRKLKRANMQYDEQEYYKATLQHMLGRLQAQQEYEICMIRELDPYFHFQEKIFGTLESIKQGKESRMRI